MTAGPPPPVVGPARPAVAATARWISILGHPFTVVLLLAVASSWNGADTGTAWRAGAVVLGAVVLPLGLFFWWRRASGRWSTVDASAPRERPALYLAALGLVLPLAAYWLLSDRSGELRSNPMLRGTVAVAILLAVGAAASRWIKLSLHTAFAVFAAVVLLRLMPALGAGVLVFAALLAWSRLQMGRHSRAEVAAGAVLGAAVGALTVAL